MDLKKKLWNVKVQVDNLKQMYNDPKKKKRLWQ